MIQTLSIDHTRVCDDKRRRMLGKKLCSIVKVLVLGDRRYHGFTSNSPTVTTSRGPYAPRVSKLLGHTVKVLGISFSCEV